MVEKKNWEDFRKTGLLFFINQILHAFGWALIFHLEGDKIKEVYPARVKFRGFGENSVDSGYKKISKYLKDNAEELYNEINEEDN